MHPLHLIQDICTFVHIVMISSCIYVQSIIDYMKLNIIWLHGSRTICQIKSSFFLKAHEILIKPTVIFIAKQFYFAIVQLYSEAYPIIRKVL